MSASIRDLSNVADSVSGTGDRSRKRKDPEEHVGRDFDFLDNNVRSRQESGTIAPSISGYKNAMCAVAFEKRAVVKDMSRVFLGIRAMRDLVDKLEIHERNHNLAPWQRNDMKRMQRMLKKAEGMKTLSEEARLRDVQTVDEGQSVDQAPTTHTTNSKRRKRNGDRPIQSARPIDSLDGALDDVAMDDSSALYQTLGDTAMCDAHEDAEVISMTNDDDAIMGGTYQPQPGRMTPFEYYEQYGLPDAPPAGVIHHLFDGARGVKRKSWEDVESNDRGFDGQQQGRTKRVRVNDDIDPSERTFKQKKAIWFDGSSGGAYNGKPDPRHSTSKDLFASDTGSDTQILNTPASVSSAEPEMLSLKSTPDQLCPATDSDPPSPNAASASVSGAKPEISSSKLIPDTSCSATESDPLPPDAGYASVSEAESKKSSLEPITDTVCSDTESDAPSSRAESDISCSDTDSDMSHSDTESETSSSIAGSSLPLSAYDTKYSELSSEPFTLEGVEAWMSRPADVTSALEGFPDVTPEEQYFEWIDQALDEWQIDMTARAEVHQRLPSRKKGQLPGEGVSPASISKALAKHIKDIKQYDYLQEVINNTSPASVPPAFRNRIGQDPRIARPKPSKGIMQEVTAKFLLNGSRSPAKPSLDKLSPFRYNQHMEHRMKAAKFTKLEKINITRGHPTTELTDQWGQPHHSLYRARANWVRHREPYHKKEGRTNAMPAAKKVHQQPDGRWRVADC